MMKSSNHIALIVLLPLTLMGCFTCDGPATNDPLFSDLDTDDQVTVKYACLGCVNAYEFELLFEGGDHVTVSLVSSGIKSVDPNEAVYHYEMSKDDVSRLDNLLRFYRSVPPPNADCSNEIGVKLDWSIDNGIFSHTDILSDKSCESEKRKDLMSFKAVAEKAGWTGGWEN